jgi:hypothetical protein
MTVSISQNFIGFLLFRVGKSKKTKRKKKEDHDSLKKGKTLKKGEADQDEVSHLSPGDESCSKGMTGMNFLIQYICFCVFNCSQSSGNIYFVVIICR